MMMYFIPVIYDLVEVVIYGLLEVVVVFDDLQEVVGHDVHLVVGRGDLLEVVDRDDLLEVDHHDFEEVVDHHENRVLPRFDDLQFLGKAFHVQTVPEDDLLSCDAKNHLVAEGASWVVGQTSSPTFAS